jgi:hypothetical protein
MRKASGMPLFGLAITTPDETGSPKQPQKNAVAHAQHVCLVKRTGVVWHGEDLIYARWIKTTETYHLKPRHTCQIIVADFQVPKGFGRSPGRWQGPCNKYKLAPQVKQEQQQQQEQLWQKP